MTLLRFVRNVLVVSSLALFAVGCSDDGNDGGDIDAGAPDADVSYVCDPVGAIPEVGGLLNAPVADDVEVIVKTPQHPGDPGPDDLP